MGKSISPGWYKDPAAPETQRYWDGEQWLGDPLPADATPPATPPQPPPPPPPVPETPQVHPGWTGAEVPQPGTARPGQQVPPELLRPGAVLRALPKPTMPAGFVSASLERRLGARLIDIAIVGVLSIVANAWLGYKYVAALMPYVREAMVDPQTEVPNDPQLTTLLYAMIAISLVLWFAYEVIGTARNGQTFGKRLVGIKVIRLDGAPADFGSSFRRWAVMAIPNLFFPCCAPVQLIDVLWCTWDKPLAQCIHDKSARTIVVSARPTDLPPPADRPANDGRTSHE